MLIGLSHAVLKKILQHIAGADEIHALKYTSVWLVVWYSGRMQVNFPSHHVLDLQLTDDYLCGRRHHGHVCDHISSGAIW